MTWVLCWCLAASFGGLGCRSTPPPAPPLLQLPPPVPPLVLASGFVPAASLEPTGATAPVESSPETFAPKPAGFLPLTESVVRTESALRAVVVELLEVQLAQPSESLTDEDATRRTARNQASGEALERYYQLADLDARIMVLIESITQLDKLRPLIAKAKVDGLKLPIEPDELDRQRIDLLGLLNQAELGAKLVDMDLKRRLGIAGRTPERLRPTELPPVVAESVDVETQVQQALETRPDLIALRSAYLKLTPENLPGVRAVLRGAGVISGLTDKDKPTPRWLDRAAVTASERLADIAELEVRRAQLFELITVRERQAADEVRAAHAAQQSQIQQLTLARAKVYLLQAKRKAATGQGVLLEQFAELEVLKARSEVISATAAWYQARAKLLIATGQAAP